MRNWVQSLWRTLRGAAVKRRPRHRPTLEALEDRAVPAAGFRQLNLVSDLPGRALFTDPNLVNPWGITATVGGGPFWVSDNGAGLSTLYRFGSAPLGPRPPVVTVPPPTGGTPPAAPTGIVFNEHLSGFMVSENGVTRPALFLFDTEDGTISGWNPMVDATHALLVVNKSPAAVYKGLAYGSSGGSNFLFATNFRSGFVDRFDSDFNQVGRFTDPALTRKGYAPFGIADLNGLLYVTFARRNKARHDDLKGPGHGFVDVFDTNGNFLRRLVSRGKLDSPWGLALAPGGFGKFGGALLVGNFGDGHIDAYDPTTGRFRGQLLARRNRPLTIDGLWGLRFGNDGSAGPPSTLFFTAGPGKEKHGLLGQLIFQADDGFLGPEPSVVSNTTITTLTGASGTYGGTITLSAALSSHDGPVAGETITFSLNGVVVGTATTNAGGTATLTGVSLNGLDVGTYADYIRASFGGDDPYNQSSGVSSLTVTSRDLAVTATGVGKVYNGATAATVTLSDDRVAGDLFTVSYVSASFGDKNVGTSKVVTVSGIRITGPDAGNYTVNGTATTTADITPLEASGSITAANKVYDGGTAASITGRTLTGVLGTDDVQYVGSTATFADKNVVSGKTVTATGLGLGGADAGNYTVNGTAATTADITARPITVTADAKAKVYGASDPALTYQITSGTLAGGDTFGGALTREPGEDVGSYAIGQGTLTAGANYELTYVGAGLTIAAAATATAPAATPNPVGPGVTVTFTATVTVVAPGSGHPAGTVTFRDGSTPLGSAPLADGTAAFATALPVGSHTITAVFASSSADFTGSTSPALTEVVTTKPVVAGISPASGSTAGGTEVTVTGFNLGAATAVKFGSVAAAFSVPSSTELLVTAPAHAPGTFDILVTSAAGTSAETAADKFAYRPPVVTAVNPASGATAGGTTVTITGTDLAGVTAVDFGTLAAASFTVDLATQITAVAPPHAAGVVDILVSNAGATSASVAADKFTYVQRPANNTPLQHLIFIMQENRSFDTYFGTYPGADGIPASVFQNGILDATTGQIMYPYHNTADLNYGGPHVYTDAIADIDNGAMDGFGHFKGQPRDYMGYHDYHEIPNYWAYAQNFVLQDHMFEPQLGWSLPSHLYLVSNWSAHSPNPYDPMSSVNDLGPVAAPTGTNPLYAWTDITYLLAKYGVSWNYYVEKGGGLIDPDEGTTPAHWNPLPGFTDVHQDGQLANSQVDATQYFEDAASGDLPAVSWVMPDAANSEHPTNLVSGGQAWVTQVVNAAMTGPDWNSTAIFISWDDWGGFYDHYNPPQVDKNGFGLRVPGLMISPWAKKGLIDHQTLSFDAYNKLIEDLFLNGARLDPATDGRPDPRPDVRENMPQVGDLLQEFDFTQTPLPPLVLSPRAIQADPGLPQTIQEGHSLTLDASRSSTSQGVPLLYTWKNGTLTIIQTTQPVVTVSWAQLNAAGITGAGSYVLHLAVKAKTSNTEDVGLTVTVPPSAAINGPASGLVNQAYVPSLSASYTGDPDADTITSSHINWSDEMSDNPSGNPPPDSHTHIYRRWYVHHHRHGDRWRWHLRRGQFDRHH
jgi:phospholipase C